MPKKNPNTELSFEELYTELEATIEKLEAGNLTLDAALALYERGTALAKQCSAMLDNAELRIQELAPGLIAVDSAEDLELTDDEDDG